TWPVSALSPTTTSWPWPKRRWRTVCAISPTTSGHSASASTPFLPGRSKPPRLGPSPVLPICSSSTLNGPRCAAISRSKKSGRQRCICAVISPVGSPAQCNLSMLAITFWASRALPLRVALLDHCGETAAMQNGQSLRVVVVGAGIVGASIAYHLARRQVAVTVLERHRPGAGASSHSFAWINAFGKEPYPYHDLNRRSVEAWRRFAQGLQADVGLHWGGEMRWVCTAADAEALRQRILQLQAWGYPNYLITAAELQQLEPRLVPRTVKAGSVGPIDGHVEPVKVIDACLQQARTHGTIVHVENTGTGVL